MTDAKSALSVRAFTLNDVPQLLALMRALARFEGYADAFAVTEQDLVARGLGAHPQFDARVVERAARPGELLGMAVTYVVPYTYDLHPDTVLKELYVTPAARGSGAGRALMRAVVDRARLAGSRRIKWLVLPDNQRARRFYTSLGAQQDAQWETWSMPVPAACAA